MIDQLDNIINAQRNSADRPNEAQLRKAAQQFEALLLQQLTKSLNDSEDKSDEDSLFGGDGGTTLAKQLFSEQIATTMSQNGGVGLQEMIMRQFGLAPENKPVKIAPLAGALNAVREKSAPRVVKSDEAEPVRATKTNAPFINRAARPEPVTRDFGSGEAEIISTFSDEVRREGIDDSLRGLMLDGRIVNSTRPRLVPNAPVTRVDATDSVDRIDATPISTPTPTPVTMPVPNPDAKVSYRLPVSGRISSDFGTRFHPVDRKMKFHGGLDIAVPTGTKVAAAAEGVVKFAGWKGGYGNTVVIQHADGSETLYGHNSKLLVTAGQTVKSGESISLSGSTGKSTGPHLHFEIRRNGNLVNPAKFLSNVLPKSAER